MTENTPGDAVRALADELQALNLATSPFTATMLGVPGYETEVPDLRAEAAQAQAAAAEQLAARAAGIPTDGLSGAERITLTALASTASAFRTSADAALVEHSLSVLGDGPSALVGLAARTRLTSGTAAEDFLVRTSRFPSYLDGILERLREGGARGRLPVARLAAVVVAQVDGLLADPSGAPFATVAPPVGWDGATAWSESLDRVTRDAVLPALARYRDVVAALPTRSDDRPGLVHLDGGAADYDALVRLHTTLDLTAEQVHARGLELVAELQEKMRALGSRLGLQTLDAVRQALRESSTGTDAVTAMRLSTEAIRRAEAAVPDWFAPPYVPECVVEPMASALAAAGMPPHYTPPAEDGSTVGTYWFNDQNPAVGSGWSLETTAFHEGVPGHHLQLARMLHLPDVPTLQTQGLQTAHAEGWGLYAEVLADEMGLYTSDEQRIGTLGAQLFRAGRLVVDTGLHALGWSRDTAVERMLEVADFPRMFVEAEVDRYIGIPGQALAYQTGLQEILRLRADAEARLGSRFDVKGFHGAVLDSGSLPLPAVATAVDTWVASLSV